MTINRNQFNGFNFKKIYEHSKELETYDGEIPLILYDSIDISNRLKFLESINKQYEYAHIKEYRKKHDIENDINEVIDFVNNNMEFEDIIKLKK